MFHQFWYLDPTLSHEVMDGAQLDMKMCHPGNQTKPVMFKNVFEESTGWQGGGKEVGDVFQPVFSFPSSSHRYLPLFSDAEKDVGRRNDNQILTAHLSLDPHGRHHCTKRGGRGKRGFHFQLYRDGVILSNIFEIKKHMFSVLHCAGEGSNTRLGCLGLQAPPKQTRSSEVGLRQAGHQRGVVKQPSLKECGLVGKQGVQCWLSLRYFPLSLLLSWSTPLRANVPWCIDEGWGLAYWARALCAFQAGICFNLFFRFWSFWVWLDALLVRGVVIHCTPLRCQPGSQVHQPLCGQVQSYTASLASSSQYHTLILLLHL